MVQKQRYRTSRVGTDWFIPQRVLEDQSCHSLFREEVDSLMEKPIVGIGPQRAASVGGTEDQLIEQRLKSELKTARARFEAAKQAFDSRASLARDIGLDHPHGVREFLNASQELDYRLGEYSAALKRFTDFILQKIPVRFAG